MDSPRLASRLAEIDAAEPRSAEGSWEIKFRPRVLADMALEPEVRAQMRTYLDSRILSHLMFAGPPACGKSSLADVIALELFPTLHSEHVLRVSAAETRSVDFIRDHVLPFVKIGGGVYRSVDRSWRSLVIFSEASGLTEHAQAALLDVMEWNALGTTMIFTTNYLERLSPALQSRCEVVPLEAPPVDERQRYVGRVLAKAGATLGASVIADLAHQHSDLRVLTRAVQKTVLQGSGGRALGPEDKPENDKVPAVAGDDRPCQLVQDIATVFDKAAVEQMASVELVEHLRRLERWCNIDTHSLARHLRAFGVRCRNVWVSARAGEPKRTLKGYRRADIDAAR